MRGRKLIRAVDTHTAGASTRIISESIPELARCSTMKEVSSIVKTKFDYIRKSLIYEPRGHNALTGALITPPISPNAHFGLIFFDRNGYLDMCGHALVGAIQAMIETGLLPFDIPQKTLYIDTLAGLIQTCVVFNDAKKIIRVNNVPSFFVDRILRDIPNLGEIKIDIAYGGNLVAIVNADKANLPLKIENLNYLMEQGLNIIQSIKDEFVIDHPIIGSRTVEMIVFSGKSRKPNVDVRNVLIGSNGQVDREPCGTGSCAKMAVLHKRGEMEVGEELIFESIFGTTLVGKIENEERIKGICTIHPIVEYSEVFLVAFHQFILDPEDPLKYGFKTKC